MQNLKKPEVLICFLACEDTPSRTMQKSEEVLAVVLAEEETKKQQVETKKDEKKMKLKFIKGGRYEPPAPSSPLLSNDFKAWRKAQRAKTDNHKNA